MLERRDIVAIVALFLVFGVGRLALKAVVDRPDPLVRRDRTSELLAGAAITIRPSSPGLSAEDWYPEAKPELPRWTRGHTARLDFYLPVGPASPSYRLDLVAELQGKGRWSVALNGRPVGALSPAGPGRVRATLLVGRAGAVAPGRNVMQFTLEGEDPPPANVPRMALHCVRVAPLPFLQGRELTYRDEIYLGSGWSIEEGNFRWTDGKVAEIFLPLLAEEARAQRLVVGGMGGGPREIELRVNGRQSRSWQIDGWELQQLAIDLKPGILEAGLNQVELHFPSPARVENDPRQLGLAFQWLRLESSP